MFVLKHTWCFVYRQHVADVGASSISLEEKNKKEMIFQLHVT
jgi:hypothetical protein